MARLPEYETVVLLVDVGLVRFAISLHAFSLGLQPFLPFALGSLSDVPLEHFFRCITGKPYLLVAALTGSRSKLPQLAVGVASLRLLCRHIQAPMSSCCEHSN